LRSLPGLKPRHYIFAILLAGAAAGCSGSGSAPAVSPRDTIAFNVSEDPHSLNPILAQSDDERQIAHLAFDMLLDVDPQGRQIPALALAVPTRGNGGISGDGRTVTYHLRRDVLWQDGQPFTSRDVAFTWRAIVAPRNNVPSTQGYDLIERIDTPDPYTAIVRLKRAWGPAVQTFFTYGVHPMPILPAHVFEVHGATGNSGAKAPALQTRALQDSGFDQHPIGTGPYVLESWERGARLIYRANPHYYRGAPRTRTLDVEEVPDTNTDLTLLRSRALDWSLLSPAQRMSLGPQTALDFAFAPFAGFGALAFNCRRPPFDDVRMRRAIAQAVDRGRLSAAITQDQYPVTDSDQPPFSWAYDSRARLPAYDPAAADAALDALGYRRGPDGMRERGGRALEIGFAVFPEGDTAVRTAEYVQAMLRERGITVNIKKVTLAHFYLPKSAGGLLMSGKFDIAYFAWRAGEDPDDSDIVTCAGPQNYAGYCDTGMDDLERLALARSDRDERLALYARIQQRLAADAPYLFLYAPRYGYAKVKGLGGFAPTPFSPTWNAWQWYKD
jgi:peptide/nickel transport system substrate-binding protein